MILQDAGMKTDLHRLVKSEEGTDDEGNTDQDDSDTHTSSLLLVLIALLIFTGQSLGTQQEIYLYYRSNEGNPTQSSTGGIMKRAPRPPQKFGYGS